MTSMQVGRRGVMAQPTAVAFTPTSISGLQAWWDASQITGLADGDPIATSLDRSGNGRDLSQATSSSRPTYKTGAMNSRAVMRFDGVDDCLTSVAFGSLSLPNTIFAVASTTNSGTGQRIILDNIGGRDAVYVNSQKWSVYAGAGAILSSQSLDTAAHVIDYTFDGASQPVRVDGVAGTPGNAGTSGISGVSYVGCVSGGGGNFWVGDIAEILIYNSALSTGNRLSVEAYLKAKWGTP